MIRVMHVDTAELLSGGTRSAREIYEELLCDWPLLAPDDATALTAALPPNVVRTAFRDVRNQQF